MGLSISVVVLVVSVELVPGFPFSRGRGSGRDRPLCWGADVGSAESVERDRLISTTTVSARIFD